MMQCNELPFNIEAVYSLPFNRPYSTISQCFILITQQSYMLSLNFVGNTFSFYTFKGVPQGAIKTIFWTFHRL